MALRFRIGTIPVRIDPAFFFTALIFNVGLLQTSARLLAVWVGVVLLSVLAHELGHAGLGLAFGLRPQIELHGLGGTTSWAAGKSVSWGKRVAISLAGPAAGMVVGGAVVALGATGAFPQLTWGELPGVTDALLGRVEGRTLGECAFLWLLWVNFGWGLLNLVPMLPLDGGNAMTSTLHALTGGRGERPARIVSLAVALLALAASAVARQWWPALLSGWFLAMNWRGLRDLRAREKEPKSAAGSGGSSAH